jgi:hypothetical protein
MPYDAMPVVCLGNATRVYSYGMVRAVNIGANARFVMFDVQNIRGEFCRVPNLVLDMPVASLASNRNITDAMLRTINGDAAPERSFQLVK